VRHLGLGAAGTVDGEALDLAAASLAARIGLPVRRTPSFPAPTYAYDPRRRQFSSTLIMHHALARIPEGAEKLLVVTECDIFIPMLSFVFGQAQLDGPVAVLSLARLRQEFHGLPPNRSLFLVRVAKEAVHEVGHTFGLTHCPDRQCVMSLATNVAQLDAKGGDLCTGCAILMGETIRHLPPETLEASGGGT